MTGPGRWRLVLVGWTLVVWVSRVRNAVADDELGGGERAVAIGVALGFVALAAIVAATWRRPTQHRVAVEVLAMAGILRWTLRGPAILVSDQWSAGFKVVHTVLWLVTVALSVLAWRELGARRRTPAAA